MFFTSDRDDTLYTRVISDYRNRKYIAEFFIKKDDFFWHAVHRYPRPKASFKHRGRYLRRCTASECTLDRCYYLSPHPLATYNVAIIKRPNRKTN